MKRIISCLLIIFPLFANSLEHEIYEGLKSPYITDKYSYALPAIAVGALVGMSFPKTFSARILTFIGIMTGGLYARKKFHVHVLVANKIPHTSGTLLFNNHTYFNECGKQCATLCTSPSSLTSNPE
jgi:hypothetical protein